MLEVPADTFSCLIKNGFLSRRPGHGELRSRISQDPSYRALRPPSGGGIVDFVLLHAALGRFPAHVEGGHAGVQHLQVPDSTQRFCGSHTHTHTQHLQEPLSSGPPLRPVVLLVCPSLEMSLLTTVGYTAATETEYWVSGCSWGRTTLVFRPPTCVCHRVRVRPEASSLSTSRTLVASVLLLSEGTLRLQSSRRRIRG